MPPAAGSPGSLARLAGCVGGGLLVAFAMPPWGFWPLAFAGVACFDLALGEEPARPQRAWAGLAFGLPWMLVGMAWMWFLTVPGYLVTSLLFGALHAAAAAAAPAGRWRTLGRPAAHTVAEIVRMLVPFGGVPLATLGISQAGGPLLVVARVGGVILLTWVVFQVGFAIAELLRRLFDRSAMPAGVRTYGPLDVVGPVAVTVVVVVALVAPSGRDRAGEPLTVAAVQGGGEQGTSALNVPSSRVTRAHLDATATIEQDDDLDLVVWPENGIDVDDTAIADSQALIEVGAEAARLGVPFAIGVTVDSEFSAHPTEGRFVNAQVVVTPGGELTGGYEKVRIVPFGEYVPLRGVLEALGAPVDQIPSDAVRGRDPAVIELPDGTEIGVMISWEVFFGDRGRAGADSDILINPTNGASYTGTIVQTQQVASSRLRAMETGRWVVQVSPTGFSAFVSPGGDVFQRTDISEQRVITMDVPLRTGRTWYTTLGDAPWVVAALALTVASLWFGGGRDRFRPRAAA